MGPLVIHRASEHHCAEEMYMTTRTSRAVRTGLRRIISDPKTSRGMRMKAIQLLMAVEGIPQSVNGKAPVHVISSANARRLKELAQQAATEKLGQGSPVSH